VSQATPPPPEQSDDELYDNLMHVDRQAYPERYQAVRDEYIRRFGDRVNGRPIDDHVEHARRARPSTKSRRWQRRLLVVLAVGSLLMLAIRAIQFLLSHR